MLRDLFPYTVGFVLGGLCCGLPMFWLGWLRRAEHEAAALTAAAADLRKTFFFRAMRTR
jgi:hypothetical protein